MMTLPGAFVLLAGVLGVDCPGEARDPNKAEADADRIVADYGLTWQGSTKPLPAAEHAPDVGAAAQTCVRIVKPPEHSADGFTYEVLIISGQGVAWVHRTGGFAGRQAWFGPLPLTP